ncbi:MAG: YraN family protein [Candidatus Paceibacterota bacterium]
MPKVFTSKTQKTGELGENMAKKFLVKHNFLILNRNYTKKWGEIDIIAEKTNKLYFIEVKSVACDLPTQTGTLNNVLRETSDPRPEDNMHPWKLKRLSRTIQTYLLSEKISDEKEWQLDLLVVFIDIKNKKAKIKVVSNIVL